MGERPQIELTLSCSDFGFSRVSGAWKRNGCDATATAHTAQALSMKKLAGRPLQLGLRVHEPVHSRSRASLPSISFSVRIPKDRPNAHSGHGRKSSGRAEFVSSSPISRRAAPRTVGPTRASSRPRVFRGPCRLLGVTPVAPPVIGITAAAQ